MPSRLLVSTLKGNLVASGNANGRSDAMSVGCKGSNGVEPFSNNKPAAFGTEKSSSLHAMSVGCRGLKPLGNNRVAEAGGYKVVPKSYSVGGHPV